jgi:hypothetical protein
MLPIDLKRVKIGAYSVAPGTREIIRGISTQIGGESRLIDFLAFTIEYLKEGGFRELKKGAFDKLLAAFRVKEKMTQIRRTEEIKRAKTANKRWSKDFSTCIKCNTTDSPYASKGECQRCFHKRNWRKYAGK